MNDLGASFLDRVHEFLGKGVSLQLISSDCGDPDQPLSLSWAPIWTPQRPPTIPYTKALILLQSISPSMPIRFDDDVVMLTSAP
ncbi:hypothetical protein LOK49_LG01G02404 [Camellia lanceoleosa]|uniref:Uncharacterized protein n=1 Tax=Camellia lanceoleosa TaxID=1840588 RepID=A0ACC0J4R0_9ERIC|nr:hypothetical protein LOK49_LG01G02404 [Camellia lanceoleosa]